MFSKQLQLIAQHLTDKQEKLAVAESCTGGWLSKVCTDLPGSSSWFDCGFITYSNEAKQHQLQVPLDMLQQYGAVSVPVVEAMLEGVLNNSRASHAAAISGVAGPGGGSVEKPVGMVVIGWASRSVKVKSKVQVFQFQGDRDRIRQTSVEKALNGLLEWVWE